MKQSKHGFEQAMTYIVDRDLKEKLRKVYEEHQAPKNHPTHEWVQRCIGSNLDNLRRILRERGEQYGVDVLFDNGQEGVRQMALVKLGRIQGALAAGEDPADSWLDLAGYAMLGLVIVAWGRTQERYCDWCETELSERERVRPDEPGTCFECTK